MGPGGSGDADSSPRHGARGPGAEGRRCTYTSTGRLLCSGCHTHMLKSCGMAVHQDSCCSIQASLSTLSYARTQILSRFRHPNIIRIIAFAPDAQAPCILLELAERGSLADALSEAPEGAPRMPWTLRLRAALGLAKVRRYTTAEWLRLAGSISGLAAADASSPSALRLPLPAQIMLRPSSGFIDTCPFVAPCRRFRSCSARAT